MGWLRIVLSVALLLLAGCDQKAAVVYRSTSPDGKRTIHAETRQMHLNLREARVSYSTDSHITQVWFGWSDSSDGISMLVCDAVDGPSVIRHSFRRTLEVDFRKSDRALIESLRAAFVGPADPGDDELLLWFCDAPGQEAFSAKFRSTPSQSALIVLPSPTRR